MTHSTQIDILLNQFPSYMEFSYSELWLPTYLIDSGISMQNGAHSKV